MADGDDAADFAREFGESLTEAMVREARAWDAERPARIQRLTELRDGLKAQAERIQDWSADAEMAFIAPCPMYKLYPSGGGRYHDIGRGAEFYEVAKSIKALDLSRVVDKVLVFASKIVEDAYIETLAETRHFPTTVEGDNGHNQKLLFKRYLPSEETKEGMNWEKREVGRFTFLNRENHLAVQASPALGANSIVRAEDTSLLIVRANLGNCCMSPTMVISPDHTSCFRDGMYHIFDRRCVIPRYLVFFA